MVLSSAGFREASQQAVPVVAIDGPGSSGKGTIAQLLAGRLGWHLLESGALYRVLALTAERHRVAPDDEPALATLARALDVSFAEAPGGGAPRVLLAGEDVTDAIRSERCGENASRVAALARVREAFLARQRGFRRPPGLVADGRDMGTVVFPDAAVKIFLTASPEERARRRYKQLKDKGIEINIQALARDIAARDERDRGRAAAPLRPAEDAVVIDTTGQGIDVALERVLAAVAARGLGPD